MITLEDLLFITNESTMVQLVSTDTQEHLLDSPIEASEVDDEYAEAIVMDITVYGNVMYIDLNV